MTKDWIALALAVSCVACGSPEAPAPPAPTPPPSVVPAAAPTPAPAVARIAAPAPPIAAATARAAGSGMLGSGDLLPFPAAPPATGPRIEPLVGLEWEAFRALLASCVPISRGTRSGYRALAEEPLEGDVLDWVPAIYSADGTTQSTRPAWWRPAPETTLLVVPYFLAGGHGGISVALFEPAPGGVRYVRHLAEAQETGESGCTPVANTIGATADGMEWRRLITCEYGGSVVSLRLRDGAVEVREQTLGDHAMPSGAWTVIAPPGAEGEPAAPAVPVPRATMPAGADLALAALCCTIADDRCPGPFGSFEAACDVLAGSPRCDGCAREWSEYGYDGDALDDLRRSCPPCAADGTAAAPPPTAAPPAPSAPPEPSTR